MILPAAPIGASIEPAVVPATLTALMSNPHNAGPMDSISTVKQVAPIGATKRWQNMPQALSPDGCEPQFGDSTQHQADQNAQLCLLTSTCGKHTVTQMLRPKPLLDFCDLCGCYLRVGSRQRFQYLHMNGQQATTINVCSRPIALFLYLEKIDTKLPMHYSITAEQGSDNAFVRTLVLLLPTPHNSSKCNHTMLSQTSMHMDQCQVLSEY